MRIFVYLEGVAVTIPWTDDPIKNRERIEAAFAAGETEINAELDEEGKPKRYRVDRFPKLTHYPEVRGIDKIRAWV